MCDVELVLQRDPAPAVRTHLPARPGTVFVSAVPNCLAPHKCWSGTAPALWSLADIADWICEMSRTPRVLRGYGILRLNGSRIPAWAWPLLRACDGDVIDLVVLPRGGGGFFNSLLKVVGAVVGIAISVWLGPTILGLGSLASGLLGLSATIGISLLADAIAPIRPPSLSYNPQNDYKSASPTYSLNASSNAMSYGAPVRKVYGRHLVPPTRIMDDYTELIGYDEYLYFLGVAGFGPLQIEDIRIGDTSINLYQGVTTQICYGWPGEPIPTIFSSVVYQTPLSIQLLTTDSLGNQLNGEAWWVTRSTERDVDEIGVDIQAPQGLYGLDDKANRYSISRGVDIRCRTAGDAAAGIPPGPWQGLSAVITAQTVGFPAAILAPYNWRTLDYREQTENGHWVSHYKYLPIPQTPYTGICYVYIDMAGLLGVASFSATGGEPYLVEVGDRPWWDRVYEWRGTAVVTNPGLPYGATLLCTVVVSGGAIASYQPSATAMQAGISVTQNGALGLAFSSGMVPTPFTRVTLYGVSGDPSKAVRMGVKRRMPYSSTGYDVQVRRAEQESNDSRVVDALYWSALRAADSTKRPYTGNIPLTMLGMRIKASNQIQNSLPLVTLVGTSILPDWDKNAKAWIERPTRNPASAYADVLRGRANFRPRPDDEIHWPSIQEWHEWCETYGYRFDGVYDTQSKVYDALADIAAAGRGSPCLIEGKWGVVWQRKQAGQPAGHVTVRNSRNFTSRRDYKEPVHGLRIKFVNEEKRWEQDELTVYAPGYSERNATLLESIELFGTTTPALAAIRGRWHLIQALLLIEQYSVTMPLEYLRLRKGQKVRVLRPEVLYGIGAAAVKRWELDEEGNMISLTWDAELQMTPGLRYAAVVRLLDGSEWTVTGASDDGRTLVLDEPMPLPRDGVEGGPLIRSGDLVMVGTAGDVGRMCLITSIKPGDNLTATVGLVDYIDELYENDNGTIPDYTPSITLPGTGPLRKAKPPRITNIRSDEWALTALPGGGTQPRIWLEWQFTDDSTTAQVQFRQNGGDGEWEYAPAMPPGTTSCYIAGVESGYSVTNGKPYLNGITYDVRVRAVNSIGWVSDWATIMEHVVVGKINPPPAPARVMLDNTRVWWEMPEYVPLDVVGWRVFMSFDAEDTFAQGKEISGGIWPTREFDVARWWGWARRVWVVTEDELGLRSEPVSVLINAGDVVVNNVVVAIRESERGWPGEAINGRLVEGCMVAESTYPFWGEEKFWS